MSIDWSEAPEGATHSNGNNFYRFNDGEWQFFMRSGWETSRDWHGTKTIPDSFASRPAPWTGEGLPPVGTVCERRTHAEARGGRYEEVRIIAYTSKGFAVWENTDGLFAGIAKENMFSAGVPAFRPIRTPEQIAEEEREKAVAEMEADIARWGLTCDYNGMCQAMYDAGYRKQVAP